MLAFLVLAVLLATNEFERVRGLALSLIGVSAGLVSLGTVLVMQALRCVHRLEERRPAFNNKA